jgi:hypothetical protein
VRHSPHFPGIPSLMVCTVRLHLDLDEVGRRRDRLAEHPGARLAARGGVISAVIFMPPSSVPPPPCMCVSLVILRATQAGRHANDFNLSNFLQFPKFSPIFSETF